MPEPEKIFWEGEYIGEFTTTGSSHSYIDGKLKLPLSETQKSFLGAYNAWVQKYPDRKTRIMPLKPGFEILRFESGTSCFIVFELFEMIFDGEGALHCQISGKLGSCSEIEELKEMLSKYA